MSIQFPSKKIGDFPALAAITGNEQLLVQDTDGTYKTVLLSQLTTSSSGTGGTGTSTGTTQHNGFAVDFTAGPQSNGKWITLLGQYLENIGNPQESGNQYRGTTQSHQSCLLSGGALYYPFDSNVDFATRDFTWSAWILCPSGGARGGLVSLMGNAAGGSAGDGGMLVAIRNGYLVMRHWLDDSLTTQSNSPIPYDQWFHIAGQRRGNIITCYLNGVKGSDISFNESVQSGNFYIGTTPNNGGASQDCIAYWDSISITNGQANYTGNFDPTTTPRIS